jgi:hypothetical protein
LPGGLAALVSVLLAGLLLVGCGAEEAGLTSGPETASTQPTTEVFPRNGDIEPAGPKPTEAPQIGWQTFAGSEVLSEGQSLRYESSEPLFKVITTQQALDSFWQTYLSQGMTPPQVDFERSFVLVGIMGVKSTGGYGISFTGLEQDGDVVRVITEWTEPAGADSVDMSFTQPYIVLRVDSTQLASPGALVVFFETEAGQQLGRVPATIP